MSELRWTDSETGEEQSLDVTGWQFVIDTDVGEVMRCDFVSLALLVSIRAAGRPTWNVSLLHPDDAPALYEPPEWWLDIQVDKR